MEKTNDCYSGAFVERGIVTAVEDDGYVVSSFDRKGITLPPLKGYDGATYSVGDKVFYFAFRDGTGRIICGL